MEEKNFMDTLTAEVISNAEERIKNNLLREFYEGLENDPSIYTDRIFSGMSDLPEVMEAFNKFYNLKPEDREYLN